MIAGLHADPAGHELAGGDFIVHLRGDAPAALIEVRTFDRGTDRRPFLQRHTRTLPLDWLSGSITRTEPFATDAIERLDGDDARSVIDAWHLHGTIAGDARSCRAFVARWSPLLTGYLTRRFESLAWERDDVMQTFWLKLFERRCRRLALLRQPRALGTFLITTLRRVTLDHLRGQPPGTGLDDWPEPGRPLPGFEDAEIVLAVLALLPERDRDILMWHDVEGRGYDEIGARLGIAAGAARAAAMRARRRFREHWQQLDPGVVTQ